MKADTVSEQSGQRLSVKLYDLILGMSLNLAVVWPNSFEKYRYLSGCIAIHKMHT